MTTLHKTGTLIIVGLLLSLPTRAQQVVKDRTYESGEQARVDSLGSINTSGDVVVKPGASVQWEATSEIHITPGFHAQPGSEFTASVFDPNAFVILVLDGDNQSSSPGAINAKPFDIAVWKNGPVINLPVTFTILSGGGSLLASPTSGSGNSLTLMSDVDGTVLAYFKQPIIPNETSIIQVTSGEKTILLHSFSTETSAGDNTGNTGENENDNSNSNDNSPGNANGRPPDWNKGKEGENPAEFVVFQPATY